MICTCESLPESPLAHATAYIKATTGKKGEIPMNTSAMPIVLAVFEVIVLIVCSPVDVVGQQFLLFYKGQCGNGRNLPEIRIRLEIFLINRIAGC